MTLDKATLDWLERRKIGMCCRCEHYYTDRNDFGNGCQWIPPEGFVMTQCYRFRHEDYTIEKGNYEDAAEFEARVAAKVVTFSVGGCEAVFTYDCPINDESGCSFFCRLKHARIEVEEEMEAESARR